MRCIGWVAAAAIAASMLGPTAPPARAATTPRPSASTALGAGWNWENPLPQGNTLNGVSCAGPQTCIAVGDFGTIIASASSGDSWFAMPSATVNNLNAISCPTLSVCYVTGDNGTILATGNGGITWANQISGQTIHVGAISCPTVTTCFALTYADSPVWSGPILRTTNGGATWIALSQTTTTRFGEGINCPNVTTCYALGGGGLVVTTDGATSWTSRGTPAGLIGIGCPGLNTCYAPDSNGNMNVTSNAGVNWTTTALPGATTGYHAYSITCPTIAACIAVGRYGITVATTDGGLTWKSQAGAIGGPGQDMNLNGVSCQSPSFCAAVGTAGAITTTENGGGYWAGASFTDDVLGVSCPAASQCVGATSTGTIVATTDGATWFYRNVPFFSISLEGVTCPSATTCYAIGTSGTIIATTDGLAWSAQSSNTTKTLFGVSCPGTSSCYAVGDNGTILSTTNGGSTWSSQASNTTNRLYAVSCPTATTCFAVGVNGTILVTTNGGSAWSAQTSGATDQLKGISCPSTTACFAVGVQGVFATTNGGTTWSNQNVTASLSGVSCQTTTSCTAAGVNPGYPYGGLVTATGDGGATWTTQVSHAGYGFTSVACSSATLCYAAGVYGAIVASTGVLPVCGSVGLTSDKASPQPGGTIVTFTATAPGCPGPQFQFWTWSAPTGWVLRQGYSSKSQFVLDTTGMDPGTYTVDVWMKWARSGFYFDRYDSFGLESWVVGGCDSATLTPNPSPTAGMQTFTAAAAGVGCGNPQYQFWLWSKSTGWVLEQAYSPTTTWSVNLDTLTNATYSVDVWVKQSGSPRTYETWALSSIPKGACGVTTVSSTQSSPQPVGTSINFNATAPGCATPSYRYWIYPGQMAGWQMLRDYRTDGTFAWDTSTGYKPGTQSIVVHVLQSGSTADYDTDGLVSFSLAGCSQATINASAPNAQGAITLQAAAPGCTAPKYQFWIYPPGGPWTMLQDYGGNSTYTWTPSTVGAYSLVVYVKQQGSANVYDSFALLSDMLS